VTTHADLGLDLDVCDTDAVADRRDELVAAVRDHAAGTIAYQLAKLQGGDYGRQELSTPGDMDRQTRGWRAGVPPVLAEVGLGRVRDLDSSRRTPRTSRPRSTTTRTSSRRGTSGSDRCRASSTV